MKFTLDWLKEHLDHGLDRRDRVRQSRLASVQRTSRSRRLKSSLPMWLALPHPDLTTSISVS